MGKGTKWEGEERRGKGEETKMWDRIWPSGLPCTCFMSNSPVTKPPFLIEKMSPAQNKTFRVWFRNDVSEADTHDCLSLGLEYHSLHLYPSLLAHVSTNKKNKKIMFQVYPYPTGSVRLTVLHRDGSREMLQEKKKWSGGRGEKRSESAAGWEGREIEERGVLASRGFYGLFIFKWLPKSFWLSGLKCCVWKESQTCWRYCTNQPAQVHKPVV